MPTQVWKSDDGNLYESKIEAIRHESRMAMRALLIGRINASNKAWNDLPFAEQVDLVCTVLENRARSYINHLVNFQNR